MDKKTRRQLHLEFKIHFKNSPDELQFLEALIDEFLEKEYKRGYDKGFLDAKNKYGIR